jgi:hypothetical protein
MRGAIKQTTTPTGSNVVPLPKRPTGADAIVAEVLARSKQESDDLTRQMEDMLVRMDARHRERAKELIPIAVRMDTPTLDDLIEIAQRMLGARARQ